KRAGAFTPFLMRLGNDGDFLNGGVLGDTCLQVQRRKPLAPRFDDVLGAIDNMKCTVVVLYGDIACMQVTIPPELGSHVRVVEVGIGQPRASGYKLSAALRGGFLRVMNLQLSQRYGMANTTHFFWVRIRLSGS